MGMRVRAGGLLVVIGVAGGLCRAQEPAPVDAGTPAPVTAEPGEQPADAPGVDTAAKEALQNASKAISEAKSLSFSSKTTYTGFLNGISYATDATIRMVRPSEGAKQWRLRATGAGSKKADQPKQSFDVLWDSGAVSWIDEGAKKLMERPKGQARGVPVQMAASSFITQFEETTPFAKELAAETISLEGTEDLGGVACDIVAVRTKGRKGVTRFWIGASDHIPRKMERSSESTTYASSTLVELSDVKLNEPLLPDAVLMSLPEGFTRDSTVAVKTAPAPPAAASDGSVTTPADSQDTTAKPETTETEPAPAAAGPQRPAAPEFELAAGDGSKVTLAGLRGKPVLLFFWGTWSLPSQGADPAVQAMHEKFSPAGLKVLALPVREKSPDAPQKFLSESGRTYTLLGAADAVAKLYGITIYPTFVVIDAEGNISARIEGWRKDETGPRLADEIGKLLPEVEPKAVPPTPSEAPSGAPPASDGPSAGQKPDAPSAP